MSIYELNLYIIYVLPNFTNSKFVAVSIFFIFLHSPSKLFHIALKGIPYYYFS